MNRAEQLVPNRVLVTVRDESGAVASALRRNVHLNILILQELVAGGTLSWIDCE